MELSAKLSLEFSTFITKNVEELIGMLQLTSCMAFDPPKLEKQYENSLQFVNNSNSLNHCQQLQTILNKIKLGNNCEKLTKILNEIVSELRSSQTFSCLMNFVDDTFFETLNVHTMMEKLKFDEKQLKEIKHQLHRSKLEAKEREIEMDEEINRMKHLIVQREIELDIEYKFAEKWINSQSCQVEFKISQEEMKVKNEILDKAKNFFESDDANIMTCKFYTRRIKEMTEEANFINQQYEKLMTSLETKLQIVLKEKQEIQAMIQEENNKFKSKKQEIREFIETKQRKIAEEKLRNLQSINILVIQAWWRGQMVRHFFGKFKTYKKQAKLIRKEFKLLRENKKSKKK
ncbi:CLUMA_CG008054, isoform A [Clunio marinus]|uniref:CLUMA_CG008054, isoform A n=1 Tax=Clunio marinus TaxID=568069 RepID=A0A1J1I2L8_9DIPT|nr:CLUMA_CG008054, isoform A [Clunio marinus]